MCFDDLSNERPRHTAVPKGDARRLFVLVPAMDVLDRPTLTTLAEYTGHNKGTIPADIGKLIEQFGVELVKDGPIYRVESWGEVLKKNSMRKFLQVRLSNLQWCSGAARCSRRYEEKYMIESSSLAAIKAKMTETKMVQEELLKKLLAIKAKTGVSTDAATLKQLNKAIKAVEKSLKLYADI